MTPKQYLKSIGGCTARTVLNWEKGGMPSRYYRRRLDVIAKRHINFR